MVAPLQASDTPPLSENVDIECSSFPLLTFANTTSSPGAKRDAQKNSVCLRKGVQDNKIGDIGDIGDILDISGFSSLAFQPLAWSISPQLAEQILVCLGVASCLTGALCGFEMSRRPFLAR